MERGRWGAEWIHAWRSGRGSSIGHFTGFGISLIWSSGFGIWKQNRREIRYWKLAREVGRQKQPSGLRDCTKFKVGITGLKDPIGDPPGRQLDEGATPQGSTRYSFIYHFWQKRCPLGCVQPPPPPVILMWKTREAYPLSQIARVLFFHDLVYATPLLAPARLSCKCCCFCQRSHNETGIKSNWLYCPCREERK